jgi:hypothetical protein
MTFGLWRLYVLSAGISSVIVPRPAGEWDWSAPATVARVLVTDRLSRNPLLGGMALILLAFAAVAFTVLLTRQRDLRLRRLALLCLGVTSVWTAFLAWSYIATFSPVEVATAASAWRYLSELGPMLIYAAFAVYGSVRASRRPRDAQSATRWSWAGAICCLLVPASLLMTWRHWRFDCKHPDVAAVRSLAGTLTLSGLGNGPMAVMHPRDAIGYAIILEYETRQPHGTLIGVPTLSDVSQPYLLDLSALDAQALHRSGTRPATELRRRDGGRWSTVNAIPEAPLSACRLGG